MKKGITIEAILVEQWSELWGDRTKFQAAVERRRSPKEAIIRI